MLVDARKRAAKAGVPFTITAEDIRAVWPKDNICPVLGLPLVWGSHGLGYAPESASLDRIHPKLGYTPDNIAVISRRANSIKNDGSKEDVRRVLAWLETVS